MDPTSLISPTASAPNAQIFEIAEIDYQAVPGGTSLFLFKNTATSDPQMLSATTRSSASSISTTPSSPSLQNIEIAQSATYHTTTSSNNTQIAYLDAENTQDDVHVPYAVHSDPQIAPRSN